ncbi:inositol monophosphatase family protein [Methylobrevis pamukkalensis]|uniref:Inositol-1-monophosphatase n=1 Tax=Methylobrevis pamukkalensis TaxID=1439726 RepID=A0A1E3H5L9_9HYPH|nr:inositol monophosphatase [Methylobrevis pamukkalensis]ODN71096.1 Inositol-1-monophosphatase [Methylobrevis pamukkalensis]
MTADIDRRFAVASAVAREAGALALDYFRKLDSLTIKVKGLQDLASEADVETELLIRRRLSEAFPEDAFLGEETGMSDFSPEQGIWVVDPIDGTQPFICGMSAWCVSIAYLRAGRIEIGLVYAPVRDEFFAVGGDGRATLNGRPMSVSTAAGLDAGMTSLGYSTRVGPKPLIPALSRLLEAGGMYHREGSGALGLCYVACGRLIGYVESHINSWDCLAGIALVNGAGGRTNDFLANDGLTRGNRLIAGPAPLYPALEAVLGA